MNLDQTISEDQSRAYSLANLVIETLDAQQYYFRHRTKEALIHSKGLERELRAKAEAIILATGKKPQQKQTNQLRIL